MRNRVVLVMVIVGTLLTLGGCYLFWAMPFIPQVAKETKAIVEASPTPDIAEQRLKKMMSKKEGLLYVEVEGMGQENSLVLEKDIQEEEPVFKVSLPFSRGVVTVGISNNLLFVQTVGPRLVLFGVSFVLVLCLVVFLLLQGMNERLLSIASYLKEAELEELDEITMEDWPPEVKQVVASVDILLRRVEKRLKLKVEEARRDRLFVHNAMVELVECLNQAAQGDLSVRAETPADIVGALGEAFNDSVAVLENRIADAQRVLVELETAFEGRCEDVERLKKDLARAKRALFYFKTEVARRVGTDLEGQVSGGATMEGNP